MVSSYERPYFWLALVLYASTAVAYGWVVFGGDFFGGPAWSRGLILLIVGISAVVGRHVGSVRGDHAFSVGPTGIRSARLVFILTAVLVAIDCVGTVGNWVTGAESVTVRWLSRLVFSAWMLGAAYGAIAIGPGWASVLRGGVDHRDSAQR